MGEKGLTIVKSGNRSVRDAGKIECPCPQCRKMTAWQDNPFRPFCSARCRAIDLGAWVDEEYRVPGDKADEVRSEDDQQN